MPSPLMDAPEEIAVPQTADLLVGMHTAQCQTLLDDADHIHS